MVLSRGVGWLPRPRLLALTLGAGVVAIGALLFMVSDSLLAMNRFWHPLPLAQFWVPATYYAAQVLIARFSRLPAAATGSASDGARPALATSLR